MLQKTIQNRTIFCKDNIEVLKGIDSNSIDLIYLDPPFNKKKIFTAPIGSSAEGASFKDYFREEDVKEEWVQTIQEDDEKLHAFLESVKVLDGKRSYNFCYLTYMAIRLIECQRILKDTGSVYLHCDPTMSHYLKILMDILFGEKNFRNEIIWGYSHGGKSKNDFGKKHDVILRYSRSQEFIFNSKDISLPFTPHKQDKKSKNYGGKMGVDETGRSYVEKQGTKDSSGEIKYYRYYLDEGKVPEDYWVDINSIQSGAKERTGYPTQKPLALLDRIIKASSHEGDVVLDPFCGCATTCVSAERLNRKWVGIDVSVKAYDLVKERLEKEVADPENLLQYKNEVHFSTVPPPRTDSSEDLGNKKYVYVISNKKYKNEYKVGVASNTKSRLNSYQTSDPNRAYRLEYSLHTTKFREIESYIHEKFENRHEWVKAKLNDIIEEIENYDKNNHEAI